MTSSTKILIRLALVVATAVLSAMQTGAAPIRNVILCIGDGMGPEQVYAASCYAGTNCINQSHAEPQSHENPNAHFVSLWLCVS